MSTIDIFVASGDELKEERYETVLVINNDVQEHFPYLKLNPVLWESDIPSGNYGDNSIQDKINSDLLERCPIVLVLFYSRLSPFTLKEYNQAINMRKKVFLYFKKGFKPKSSEDEKHYDDLKAFKNRTYDERKVFCREFNDIKHFHATFYQDLKRHLEKTYQPSALDEEVQPNDQEMMTPKKKVDRTENERKNILWQEMESRMVKIPGGKVLLKDTWSENQFTAEISSFFIDKYPVTQALYEKVMGEEKNKSTFKDGGHPVKNVKWFDAVEFCNRLSDKTGLKPVYTIDGEKVKADWDAKGFRLPTEAEWRYACRAGTTGERYGEINLIAWYKDNSKGTTHEVGKKEPNPWGLYDMLGNVYEWCWDWSGPYPTEDKKDWRGHESCFYRPPRRVTPGGSWFHSEEYCTCTDRNHGKLDFSGSHLGFRLARSL
jgi:formylglycine-generating enzyme required for sulfatase activity